MNTSPSLDAFKALREETGVGSGAISAEALATLVLADSIRDLQSALEAASNKASIGNRFQREAFRDLSRAVQQAVNADDDWHPI